MEVGLALWAMGSQRQGQDREVPLAGSQGLPEFSAGASILQTLLLFPLCRPESEAQGGEITCTQVHRLSMLEAGFGPMSVCLPSPSSDWFSEMSADPCGFQWPKAKSREISTMW